MRSLAVLLAVPLMQEPPDDASRKLAERAERAAGWLADADPELRAMGRKEARELGSAATPALEKRLGSLLDVAKAWSDSVARPAAFVREEELEEVAVDEKVDRAFIDKYLRAKYAEALALAKKKSYQRAYDLAGALLSLEPRAANAEAVRRLRRHCDAMILQTTLLEAKLLHAKPAYAAGEAVELSLRMKNIFRSGLTVSFGKGEEGKPAPRGVVVVEVETTIRDFYGASNIWTRSQEIHVDNEIPVAPGAQWEKSFLLEPSLEIGDQEHVREVVVNAWTQPSGIALEGRDAGRRILFESAFLRIVPKKYERFLENPLEWLGKTLESGTAQHVYICSRLLEGKDREAGVERLVKELEKSNDPKQKAALSWILKGLTGQALGEDGQAWREWLEKKKK
jgi:hypothetical protein